MQRLLKEAIYLILGLSVSLQATLFQAQSQSSVHFLSSDNPTQSRHLQTCHSNCQTCSGNLQTDCTLCVTGLFFNSATSLCLSNCPSQFYQKSSTRTCEGMNFLCIACNTYCQECTGPSSSECTSCATGKYKVSATTCKDACEAQQYSSNFICYACHSNCNGCSGSLDSQCTQCVSSAFLHSPTSQCLSTCPSGYYGDTNDKLCKACHSNCNGCTGPLNSQCNQCASSVYLHSTTSECLSSCPHGFYPDNSDKNCKACHSNCNGCTGPLNTECSQCASSVYFHTPTSQCLSSCPHGFYPDNSDMKCKACHSNCDGCTGPLNTECNQCASSIFFHTPTTECLTTCPDAFYGDTSDSKCKACHSYCATCTGPANSECPSCTASSFAVSSTLCDTSCLSTQYADANKICHSCSDTCLTCSNAGQNNCLTCTTSSYAFNPTTCLSVCPDGYWHSQTPSKSCQQCDPSCLTCSAAGTTKCLSCDSPLFLTPSGTCEATCPSHYYSVTTPARVCLQCNQYCLECSGATNTQCLSCQSISYIVTPNTHCDSTCPAKTYPDNSRVCQDCHPYCNSCIGPSNTECPTCDLTQYVKRGNNWCDTVCSSQFYIDSNRICQACNAHCDECHGPANTECTNCQSTSFKVANNHCDAQCPSNMYVQPGTNICAGKQSISTLDCHQYCATCSGPSNTQCLTCDFTEAVQLTPTTCLASCPSHKYPDSQKYCQGMQCQSTECDVRCAECTDAANTDCTSCATGIYLLSAGHCDYSCPVQHFYPDNADYKCKPCDPKCKTCFGQYQTQCPSCSDGNYLQPSSQTCLPTCPSKYYPDSNNVCQPCHAYCAECTGPLKTQCTSCVTPNVYTVSPTYCDVVCPAGRYPDNNSWTCPGTSSFIPQTVICTVPPALVLLIPSVLPAMRLLSPSILFTLIVRLPVLLTSTLILLVFVENVMLTAENAQVLLNLNVSGNVAKTSVMIALPLHSMSLTMSAGPTVLLGVTKTGRLTYVSVSVLHLQLVMLTAKPVTVKRIMTVSPAAPTPTMPLLLRMATVTHPVLLIECHQYCGECFQGTKYACHDCNETLAVYYGQNYCDIECPVRGYWQNWDDYRCDYCNPLCLICETGSTSPCSECTDLAYLFTETSACVAQCPPGFFPDSARVCQKCFHTCEFCFGKNYNECTSCVSPYFFYNNTCISECPDGYYGDEISLTCLPCSPECLTCFGPTTDQCFSCDGWRGYGLIGKFSCVKLQCATGQFLFLSATPSCTCKSQLMQIVCDYRCADCTGPLKTQCTRCSFDRVLVGSECILCDEITGLKAPPDGLNECLQICGDGLHLGYNECDDANTLDDDGCNGFCQLEPGFRCSGGSPTSPDVCVDIMPPLIIQGEMDQTLNVNLTLSEPSLFTTELLPSNIALTFFGPLGVYNYDVAVRMPDLNKLVQIISFDLTFQHSLIGGQKDILQISIPDPSVFQDLAGNKGIGSTVNVTLPYYFYISDAEQKALTQATESMSTATLSGLMINLGIVIGLTITMEAMWSFVNAIQLLNFLPLVNVKIPDNMTILFDLLSFANMEIELVEVAFTEYMMNKDQVQSTPLNDRFEKYGYENRSILVNSSAIIMIWAIMAFIFPFALLFSKKLPCPRGRNFFKSFISGLRYNVLLRIFIESYLDLTISAILNMTDVILVNPQLRFSNKTETISSTVALLVIVILFYLPFFIVINLSRPSKELLQEKNMQRFGMLYEQLDIERRPTVCVIHFYTIFIFRRLFFILLLIFGEGQPRLQVVLLMVSSLLMLIWLNRSKPIKDKRMQCLEQFNEVIILMVSTIIGILYFEELIFQHAKLIGWGAIGLVALCLVVNILLVMPCQFKGKVVRWHQKCKNCRKKKFTAVELEEIKEQERKENLRMRNKHRRKWNSIKNQRIDSPLHKFSSSSFLFESPGESDKQNRRESRKSIKVLPSGLTDIFKPSSKLSILQRKSESFNEGFHKPNKRKEVTGGFLLKSIKLNHKEKEEKIELPEQDVPSQASEFQIDEADEDEFKEEMEDLYEEANHRDSYFKNVFSHRRTDSGMPMNHEENIAALNFAREVAKSHRQGGIERDFMRKELSFMKSRKTQKKD